MKKLKILFISTSIFIFFASCGSALQLTNKAHRLEFNMGGELIEFVGFKNSYTDDGKFLKDTYLLKNFGKKLARTHVAIDRADFYTGIYSFQEFEKYKSTKRYISFVDVMEHSLIYDDEYDMNVGWYSAGLVIAIMSGYTLFPIYLPMMLGAKSNKCLMTLKGEYKIYIYDTLKKEIVMVLPLLINEKDVYKGKYSHNKTNKTEVDEYYEAVLYNKFFEQYEKAYYFIKNTNE